MGEKKQGGSSQEFKDVAAADAFEKLQAALRDPEAFRKAQVEAAEIASIPLMGKDKEEASNNTSSHLARDIMLSTEEVVANGMKYEDMHPETKIGRVKILPDGSRKVATNESVRADLPMHNYGLNRHEPTEQAKQQVAKLAAKNTDNKLRDPVADEAFRRLQAALADPAALAQLKEDVKANEKEVEENAAYRSGRMSYEEGDDMSSELGSVRSNDSQASNRWYHRVTDRLPGGHRRRSNREKQLLLDADFDEECASPKRLAELKKAGIFPEMEIPEDKAQKTTPKARPKEEKKLEEPISPKLAERFEHNPDAEDAFAKLQAALADPEAVARIRAEAEAASKAHNDAVTEMRQAVKPMLFSSLETVKLQVERGQDEAAQVAAKIVPKEDDINRVSDALVDDSASEAFAKLQAALNDPEARKQALASPIASGSVKESKKRQKALLEPEFEDDFVEEEVPQQEFDPDDIEAISAGTPGTSPSASPSANSSSPKHVIGRIANSIKEKLPGRKSKKDFGSLEEDDDSEEEEMTIAREVPASQTLGAVLAYAKKIDRIDKEERGEDGQEMGVWRGKPMPACK